MHTALLRTLHYCKVRSAFSITLDNDSLTVTSNQQAVVDTSMKQVTIESAIERGFSQKTFDDAMLQFFIKADVPFVTVENDCISSRDLHSNLV